MMTPMKLRRTFTGPRQGPAPAPLRASHPQARQCAGPPLWAPRRARPRRM